MKLLVFLLITISVVTSWAQLGVDPNDCQQPGASIKGLGTQSSLHLQDYDNEPSASAIPNCENPCVKGGTCDHATNVALGAPTGYNNNSSAPPKSGSPGGADAGGNGN